MTKAAECTPCTEAREALTGADLENACRKLPAGWRVIDNHHLERKFTFPDFRTALEFTNRVGEAAEELGHHPDIYLGWGEVRVSIWTHKVDGLTLSDFQLAERIPV
jgi:4a-hydroxytetrahydrobiopterin dehydratase